MRSPLQKVASLRVLLSELEREVGIEQIGSIEKRVLLSIADLTSSRDITTTKLIKAHPLNSAVTQPSFYRAISKLERMGKIKRVGEKRGLYATVE